MQHYRVDTLTFSFSDGWQVSKYDEWLFYRNRFGKMRNGIKALDLLAISPAGIAWLIEAKDYRRQRRTKPSSLPDEVAQKVLDTLAAIVPAKVNGDVPNETAIATAVTAAHSLRVVLHLEQPRKHSKLFPRAINPADVQMKLRQILKPVDAHPLVAEINDMRNLQWTVA
jgi:hypothetical protein